MQPQESKGVCKKNVVHDTSSIVHHNKRSPERHGRGVSKPVVLCLSHFLWRQNDPTDIVSMVSQVFARGLGGVRCGCGCWPSGDYRPARSINRVDGAQWPCWSRVVVVELVVLQAVLNKKYFIHGEYDGKSCMATTSDVCG